MARISCSCKEPGVVHVEQHRGHAEAISLAAPGWPRCPSRSQAWRPRHRSVPPLVVMSARRRQRRGPLSSGAIPRPRIRQAATGTREWISQMNTHFQRRVAAGRRENSLALQRPGSGRELAGGDGRRCGGDSARGSGRALEARRSCARSRVRAGARPGCSGASRSMAWAATEGFDPQDRPRVGQHIPSLSAPSCHAHVIFLIA